MAICALVLLAVLVFLLTGDKKFFSEDVIVYTFLDDSAALTPGSPVRLNGILIGSIKGVGLSGENVDNRVIKVSLGIDREMLRLIPTDSVAAIASENVLGSKYININEAKVRHQLSPAARSAASTPASLRKSWPAATRR